MTEPRLEAYERELIDSYDLDAYIGAAVAGRWKTRRRRHPERLRHAVPRSRRDRREARHVPGAIGEGQLRAREGGGQVMAFEWAYWTGLSSTERVMSALLLLALQDG